MNDSTDNFADTPAIADEFADGASAWPTDLGGVSRRRFLRLMAASLALGGATGCDNRPRDEVIVPLVKPPDGVVPGRAKSYATAMPLSGYARGVIATSREGRPIKLDGNPDHPASLGGSDVFLQAALLDLYDPSRGRSPTYAGTPRQRSDLYAALDRRLESHLRHGGRGLRFLSGAVTSPTLRAQMKELGTRFPQSIWHCFEPISSRPRHAGAIAAFGRPLDAVYDFSKAAVVLSLDSDFLFDMPGSLRFPRDFMAGRRVRSGKTTMNRLYVIESTLSITGSVADERQAMRPSRVEPIVRQIAAACGIETLSTDSPGAWAKAVAADLVAHRGASIVIAGDTQPPVVHHAAHLINRALGNVGVTVRYIEPIEPFAGEGRHTLQALAEDLRSGVVQTLLILSDNPVNSAPGDVDFGPALLEASRATNAEGTPNCLTIHLSARHNATSAACQWHLPEAHFLEEWSDVRAFDGTASIVQPLIQPLFDGISPHAILERLLGRPDRSAYEIVRGFWRSALAGEGFEKAWHEALRTGMIAGSQSAPVDPGVPRSLAPPTLVSKAREGIELTIRPDYAVWDGRFATNAWLQELPRPFTKMVWDNAVLVSPATAAANQIREGDVVRIAAEGRSLEGPVAILAGLPDEVLTLHLGYGQSVPSIGEETADEPVGFNASRLQSDNGFVSDVTLTKTGATHPLVFTRSHHAMTVPQSGTLLSQHSVVTSATPEDERERNNRRLIRVATIDEFVRNPEVIRDLGGAHEKKPLLSLYPGWKYDEGYQWGMSVDLTACIGCNACVVACQAENNIPVVGKEQVAAQREMHWLRVDDYLEQPSADPSSARVHHQPVPCMHCENAPCEYVCPVGATTHSVEGLNQMTYNRCVGTRYCSNNCPYKVRRFNFLSYASYFDDPQRRLMANPEVSVRTNGVMEKCTYCIQRLQRARIDAEALRIDGTDPSAGQREFELIDGLQTACAQACPTRAIAFGSIRPVAGRDTTLMAEKRQPHDYSLLRELTTKPRTTYLGRIVNPNPELREGQS